MKFRKRNRISPMTELNITPLMDLAFSLLIIFMISTPLLEQTIPVNLPKQDSDASSARPEIEFQVISMDSNAQIYWGKQPVDLLELDSLLASLANQPDPAPISFRCDLQNNWQQIVNVFSAIQRHKLSKLHIDTSVK